MPSVDAPDWQRVVTTVTSTGAVPDAPDWQRIVVGPAGTPIGPTPGGGVISPYFTAGFIGVSGDPTACNNSFSHANGVLSLVLFSALATKAATSLWAVVNSGEAVTAHENFMTIYDTGQTTAGTATLIGATAVGACDTPFTVTGVHQIALSAPVPLIEGENYYVGIISNGSTPGFVGGQVNTNFTLNPLGLTLPFRAFGPGPYTTPPASLAFAAMTLTNTTWLVYVS